MGIDVLPWVVERSADTSVDVALVESGVDTTAAVNAWTHGLGVDAVLLTAATKSSDPIRRAPDLARDRATIVLVGDVGLELDRRPLYEKELSIKVARSYGPGRYERGYEEWGVDYPAGHVRWTEGRNLEAFVGLLDRGAYRWTTLITHRFAFDSALAAYELLETDEQYLGVELTYTPDAVDVAAAVRLKPAATARDGIGLIGAGAFARGVLVPALQAANFTRFVSVTSASGLSATRLGDRVGFERAAPSAEAVIDDPEVSIVVIATPHDTHAGLASAALRAGKHVFCEKPLALTDAELDDVEEAWKSSECQLFVGFNRRYSPAVVEARRRLTSINAPVVMTYRVNAGQIAAGHWYSDRRQGGRLLGEVCHFIDTSAALAGSSITNVAAFAGDVSEASAGEDVVIALRFTNGSLATITYASGGSAATPKEHVEILSGGHTMVIDDYRLLTIDGSTTWSGTQDKGHHALVAEFARSMKSAETGARTEAFLDSSRVTLTALCSVLDGRAIDVDHT